MLLYLLYLEWFLISLKVKIATEQEWRTESIMKNNNVLDNLIFHRLKNSKRFK